MHFWQHGRIGDSMVVTDEVQHRPFAADLLTYQFLHMSKSVDQAMNLREKLSKSEKA